MRIAKDCAAYGGREGRERVLRRAALAQDDGDRIGFPLFAVILSVVLRAANLK